MRVKAYKHTHTHKYIYECIYVRTYTYTRVLLLEWGEKRGSREGLTGVRDAVYCTTFGERRGTERGTRRFLRSEKHRGGGKETVNYCNPCYQIFFFFHPLIPWIQVGKYVDIGLPVLYIKVPSRRRQSVYLLPTINHLLYLYVMLRHIMLQCV